MIHRFANRFVAVGLSVLLSTSIAAASSNEQNEVPTLLAEGSELLARGEVDAARKVFARARKLSSKKSIGAAMGLSQVALRERKWDIAEQRAADALRLAQESNDPSAQAGALWLVAMAHYQNAIEARDNGLRKANAGALAASRETLQAALADGLGSNAHRLLLAEVLLEASQKEEARRQLDAYYSEGPSPASVERADNLRCFVGSDLERTLYDEVQYVGGEVSKPVGKHTPPPRYNELLSRNRWQGKVFLATVLGADGRIACARVLRGGPYGASDVALGAVRGWEYEPAQKNGVPVPVAMNLTIGFDIR